MKINGSLVFDASAQSQITNLRVEKVLTGQPLPTHAGAADAGRLIYEVDSGILYKGIASAWEALATGGNAFSQVEGDAIETSLGAGINGDGTFNAAGFDTPIATATSFTDAINQLAAYAVGNDTLFELNDVSLSGALPAGPAFLYINGGNWVDHTLVLADVSDVTATAAEVNELAGAGAVAADFTKLHDVTATAAELNILDGATLTTTELNYVDGVTSAIQAQLDNKQPLDATLTRLAALAGTGIVVETGADTFTNRTLVAPAAGITITDAGGIAGNPTFALANDLAAIEGLTTTGYVVRTGDGTATTCTIAGTTSNIVVTNGDGVTSDTSIDLAPVTQASSGDFVKVTLDGFGRVTGNTAVVLSDIEALAESVYVHTAGDVMDLNASLTFSGTGTVTGIAAPSAPTDATNKAYVDALVAGLSWKQAVRAASTGDLTLASTTTVDGVTLVSGDRVLVKDQTAPEENGIYTFDGAGLVRAADMDVAAEFAGATVFVTEGTANADSGWTQTAEVTTLDTDAVSFVRFSGSSSYVWGIGLVASGNTVNINVGAGIAELPSDEVGIDLYDAANGALALTSDGTTRSTDASTKLTLVLDPAGALAQTSSGLKIDAASVTNAMLVNGGFSLNSDSASPSAFALGDALEIVGDSIQGIVTSHAAGAVTITASDASSSQKGVASFDANDFTVTAGNVVIALAGVDNNQLANSTIGFIGTDASSDTVALGSSLTIADGGAASQLALVKVGVAAGTATVTLREATATATGVASFDAAHFSVTSGAVSLAASLDDLTNVSTADTAATGDLLTKTAGDWQPISRVDMMASVNLGDLGDVGTAPATTAGTALIADGSAWQAAKIYHRETVAVAATTWTVSHAIGQQYCNVTIVDATNNVVIPQSIVFDSATQLTVTFNTAVAGKCVVMGVA